MLEDNLSSSSSTSTHSDSSNNLPSINEFPKKDSSSFYSIIGIGDPIVDILSEISLNEINKYQLKLGDSIFASEDYNERNVEMFKILESMSLVSYTPGGSVQNTIRVISWCLNNNSQGRKNYKISMLGSVGDDLYKNKIMLSLEDIGVNPILEILKGDKTSRCGVGIYKKEKLFVTQLRASKRLSEKFIEENLDKILDHQAFLIEGYLLNNKFNIVKKLCDLFYEKKKMIILTLSAEFIVKMHYEKIIELGNKSNIIDGSMGEARALARIENDNYEEVFKSIFKKLKPNNERLLLITDGPNGAYCAKYNYENDDFEFIIRSYAKKIKEEEIKDFNGAGDAFLGGFLSEYMKGSSIIQSCKNGINAASVILKNVGCTFPRNTTLGKN